ncbi:MAG: NADH:ubiquinone reductase (Na(+)-transporting) subunit F [Bacteroidales bacterium]|jgi:Na+-transporting NADH:ubiquinone oxidoreductase subunit F|nr:NADH:ubiquinone reductase (Na(+)-transporting) subunit F [Bacteroidales bacterium]MBQ1830904.1 NADH:ubiquinone reductase (Na(+)-transporting) subunit F [Bacteroidales bacterium]MBQ3742583.1 NADH:ubiquinone reductase (Na(+)-transporting) subunit F [Bacteroidales bacterium]MBQ4221555.1 NADH:ubiquinone reductase (Na(+)-transporting) subunit F [Bacteroidales bacterium]MBQ5517849.1 NADH:ubiquinone reductase (Na(+)-transporting) subunit F [Bacteroidales bacterium]
MTNTILAAILVIVVVTLILVALLLFIKTKLTPSGTVKIDINDGKKVLDVPQGGSLLNTLAEQKIFLPSACGGKGNCGQCKCQVLEGGGSILPTEVGFFTRKQIADNWRLGCQVKVKDNLKIQVPDSALSVKKLECEVISNKNVATFIKEFTVRLPEGENIEFKSGEYIQIDIPEYDVNFADMDVDPIYRGDWEKYGFFDLKHKNTVPTIRAYSMASYPAEKNVIKLNVRIATPPFDRSQPKGVFKMLPVPPGIASTYVFSRKPGDKVWISGPYGEFLLPKDDPDSQEYIFVGGGAGMAPLRSHIMHLFKTLKTKKEVHFFYGARALVEAFYLEDFAEIEKEFPNFHFHLALDRPDPAADAAGVKYTAGFVHNVMNETYLKNHEAPEDIKYFMCGPPMMVSSVVNLLDSLGVAPESILYDNFGG